MSEPRPAANVASDYVAAVNDAALDRLRALFAPDAVLAHPTGTYEGIAAITAFYRDVVFAGRAVLTPGRSMTDGRIVFLELAAGSPLAEGGLDMGPTLHTVDVFDVGDDGRITRLAVYYL